MNNLFIKAAEVWLPDKNGLFLSLGSSYYGKGQQALASASRNLVFGFNEGMPGQTWAKKRPLMWTDLLTEEFLRSQFAAQADISCGISIPIYSGDFLLAVLILFCGRSDEVSGAVEIWNNPRPGTYELRLVDGYYGDLEKFEFISRRLTIMKGHGLPGTAWESMHPIVIEDLGHSNTFIRSRNAQECGITTGLAIPLQFPCSSVHIISFLSANGTPIAKRFEVWIPNEDKTKLTFLSGSAVNHEDLSERYREVEFSQGSGALGEVWLSGRPLILREKHEAHILIPTIQMGKLTSIVNLVI